MTEIRTTSAADVDLLAALRRAWVEEQAGGEVRDVGFEHEFADWFAAEQHQRVTWIALDAGRPVGMLNLLVFTRMPKPGRGPSRWGYLANFFVLAGHRDRGVGTRLLSACLDHADSHAFVRVVLSPSERSAPLYARSGFRPAADLLVRPGRGHPGS